MSEFIRRAGLIVRVEVEMWFNSKVKGIIGVRIYQIKIDNV